MFPNLIICRGFVVSLYVSFLSCILLINCHFIYSTYVFFIVNLQYKQQTKIWYLPLSFSPSSFSQTFLIACSKASRKNYGHKASACFWTYWFTLYIACLCIRECYVLTGCTDKCTSVDMFSHVLLFCTNVFLKRSLLLTCLTVQANCTHPLCNINTCSVTVF